MVSLKPLWIYFMKSLCFHWNTFIFVQTGLDYSTWAACLPGYFLRTCHLVMPSLIHLEEKMKKAPLSMNILLICTLMTMTNGTSQRSVWLMRDYLSQYIKTTPAVKGCSFTDGLGPVHINWSVSGMTCLNTSHITHKYNPPKQKINEQQGTPAEPSYSVSDLKPPPLCGTEIARLQTGYGINCAGKLHRDLRSNSPKYKLQVNLAYCMVTILVL